jgi:hypothetical protein
METKEFIAKVQDAGRELPAIAIKEAIDFFLDTYGGPYSEAQKRQAVLLAGRFAALRATEQSSDGKDSLNLMLSQSVTGSEILCDVLEPDIVQIRHGILGPGSVPFSNDAAAIKWIEDQRPPSTKKSWPFSTELRDIQKSAEAQRKFRELKMQIEALTGFEIHYTRRFYSYPDFLQDVPITQMPNTRRIYSSPDFFQNVPITQIPIIPGRGDKLHILTLACHKIADSYGFNAALVSWWVLRGLRPILPRVVISRVGRPIGPPATMLTINGVSNLTWREAWEAFQNIQKVTGIIKKGQDVHHYKIRQFVESRGGIPAHGSKTKFWESIRLDIQKEFGKAPRTWQAIRKSYFAGQ